jgi:archaellum biogenesis protein FlaJ (TadC family)
MAFLIVSAVKTSNVTGDKILYRRSEMPKFESLKETTRKLKNGFVDVS